LISSATSRVAPKWDGAEAGGKPVFGSDPIRAIQLGGFYPEDSKNQCALRLPFDPEVARIIALDPETLLAV